MIEMQDVCYIYPSTGAVTVSTPTQAQAQALASVTAVTPTPAPSPALAPALDHVSLTINRGEFVAIIGRNGSGKSTLAKLLNALLLPTTGRVLVNGMDTSDPEVLWQIRRRVGMVFQNPDNQLVASVVEEDVAFGPENLGVPPVEIKQRVNEALAAVGMSDFAHRPPHLLSGGQKQRVAIAGMLAMRPDCLVLDEPTAQLDPVGRSEVMRTVSELNREMSLTVVHITHYMEEAIGVHRVIVMDRGRVVMQGRPPEIFSRVAALKEMGLGVPQMADLAGQLQAAGLVLPAGILTVDEMVCHLCS